MIHPTKTGCKHQNVVKLAFLEHVSMKSSILIPVRAKLLYPFRYETPCMLPYTRHYNPLVIINHIFVWYISKLS